MPSTTAMLFNAAGQMVFAPIGRPDPSKPGIAFGGDGAPCCPPYYIEARRCSDNALVDLWFQYLCSGTPPTKICFANTSVGGQSLPFYFTLDADVSDPKIRYYVSANDPAKCDHGTIAGDITIVPSCGECPKCADDNPSSLTFTPTGQNINTNSGFIETWEYNYTFRGENKFTFYRTTLKMTVDVTLSAECICQSPRLGQCSWEKVIQDAGTVQFNRLTIPPNARTAAGVFAGGGKPDPAVAPDPGTGALTYIDGGQTLMNASAKYDLRYTVTKTDTGMHATIVLAYGDGVVTGATDGATDANLNRALLPLITFVIFDGEVTTANCNEDITVPNTITSSGPTGEQCPLLNTLGGQPLTPRPYAALDSSVLPSAPYCFSGFVSPADWCATHGVGINVPGWYISGGGSVALAPSSTPCPFTPKYRLTFGGTAGRCDGTHRGRTTIDGVFSNGIVGIPINVPNTTVSEGTVDHVDSYSAPACTGVVTTTESSPASFTIDIPNQVSGAHPSVHVTVEAFDSSGLEIWRGEMDIGAGDILACGYPSGLVIPVKTAGINNPYSGGAVTLELMNPEDAL